MADQSSETFVDRVVRELRAFAALWRTHKMLFVFVLGVGAAIAYPHFEPLFRHQTIEDTFDPDKVFVVKALVKSPTDGKEHYDYFIKVDGGIWFEVYSEPNEFARYTFMFKLVRIKQDEIILIDDTRHPNVTVTLRMNFKEKAIYYKASDQDEESKLYDILRYEVLNR